MKRTSWPSGTTAPGRATDATPMLTGTAPRAQGFVIEGYGVFFAVEVGVEVEASWFVFVVRLSDLFEAGELVAHNGDSGNARGTSSNA